MIDGKSIALVLPCHNEARALVEMLPRIPECIDEVIVVDNGSLNGTAKVAWFFKASVVHVAERGYGIAIKAGLCHATQDIIVVMDGDDSYPLDGLERNIQFLIENDLDFVSCSRFPLTDPTAMKKLNHAGNRILALVARLLCGLPITDLTTGMWIFKNWYKEVAWYCSDGFVFCVEFKILVQGIRFAEVHIDYRPRIGEVKQPRWRAGMSYLWALVKYKIGR